MQRSSQRRDKRHSNSILQPISRRWTPARCIWSRVVRGIRCSETPPPGRTASMLSLWEVLFHRTKPQTSPRPTTSWPGAPLQNTVYLPLPTMRKALRRRDRPCQTSSSITSRCRQHLAMRMWKELHPLGQVPRPSSTTTHWGTWGPGVMSQGYARTHRHVPPIREDP